MTVQLCLELYDRLQRGYDELRSDEERTDESVAELKERLGLDRAALHAQASSEPDPIRDYIARVEDSLSYHSKARHERAVVLSDHYQQYLRVFDVNATDGDDTDVPIDHMFAATHAVFDDRYHNEIMSISMEEAHAAQIVVERSPKAHLALPVIVQIDLLSQDSLDVIMGQGAVQDAFLSLDAAV